MKHLGCLVISLIMIGCSPTALDSQVATRLADVSLVRLLATPEKFEGSSVRTLGFLQPAHSGSALHLNQEDAKGTLVMNALWLKAAPCLRQSGAPIRRGYVLIEATFTAVRHGPNNVYSGELSDVTRCVQWPLEMPPVASNNSFKPRPLRGSA